MRKNYRRSIALIILVSSAVLMIWSLVPGGRILDRQVLDKSVMNPRIQVEGKFPAILEERVVRLEWPRSMRIGEKSMIRLEFLPVIEGTAQEGITNGFIDAYDSHNIMAEARFEVSGMRMEPSNPTRESMPPGQTVKFKWDITAAKEGEYSGRVWLSLRFLPIDGNPPVQVPIYVRELRLDASSILGMSGETARAVSGVGIMLGGSVVVNNVIRRKKNSTDNLEEQKKHDDAGKKFTRDSTDTKDKFIRF